MTTTGAGGLPVESRVIGTSGNTILVNPRQKRNPVLKWVQNCPYEYADILPDYVLGRTTCALFLSLKYHRLHPEYIYTRLKEFAPHHYLLRILLVLIDVDENHQATLRELHKAAFGNQFCIIVAWSNEEAGRYLETYKLYEKKGPETLKERIDDTYLAKVTDCLTSIKSVNKTDVMTLTTRIGSIKNIASASREQLEELPGFGQVKAQRVFNVFREPFRASPKTG